LGRSEEALEAQEKAITIDPKERLYWFQKGLALRALGRFDEALESYDRAIELGDNKFAPVEKDELLKLLKKST